MAVQRSSVLLLYELTNGTFGAYNNTIFTPYLPKSLTVLSAMLTYNSTQTNMMLATVNNVTTEHINIKQYLQANFRKIKMPLWFIDKHVCTIISANSAITAQMLHLARTDISAVHETLPALGAMLLSMASPYGVWIILK